MFLGKEDILSVKDLKTEFVNVPEWGGDVRVSELTGKGLNKFQEKVFFGKGKDHGANYANMTAWLVVLTVVDEQGNRIFLDADVDMVGGKGAKALGRIFEVAQKLNAIGKDEVDALTKN